MRACVAASGRGHPGYSPTLNNFHGGGEVCDRRRRGDGGDRSFKLQTSSAGEVRPADGGLIMTGTVMPRLGPVDVDLGDVAVAVLVLEVAVSDAVFVHLLGDLDVVAAVFGNSHHRRRVAGFFVFLPPAQGIESVGGFAGAEGCLGERVEFESVPEGLFHLDEHVEVDGAVGEVEDGVALEHGVVEVEVVVSDDEVGAGEHVYEFVGLVLAEDVVLPGAG